MALVGTTESFYTYKNKTAKYKRYVNPNMSSNGTWLSDGYSCRTIGTMTSTSYAYRVFNGGWSSYCDKFNEGAYIEICLPEPIAIAGIDISSSNNYLPANGIVLCSDDGENYEQCGEWQDTLGTSKSAVASIDSTAGSHRIWRLQSTSRSLKYPSKNADISGASLWYYEYFEVDESLPDGAGGWSMPYIMQIPHNGLDIRKLDVFYTYKRDDLVNLWEGMERPEISGVTTGFVTHKPHNGLDVRELSPYVQYRPHDGLDIRKLDVFALVRQEEKVDTFKIPYGIGGYVGAYALYRILLLVGYLNDFGDKKIQGIALENNYIPLKGIETINRISLKNNTTEDIDDGKEG